MEVRHAHQWKDNFSGIAIIGVLFFIFGFLNWLNSLLIPYFKIVCRLDDTESMLVAFIFYFTYFLMALPASYVLRYTGFKRGITVGLWIMGVGALVFIPASLNRSYPGFLSGLFVQATGLTLLQTAANPYVTIMGPIESAARRISIMGVCNKIAGALAPLIFIRAITKSPNEIDELKQVLPALDSAAQTAILDELVARLILPYIVMALALFCLGMMIKYSPLADIKESHEDPSKTDPSTGKNGILAHPYLLLGAVAIFFGVGVEVLAVDSIIGYSEYGGHSFRTGKFFASYTLLIMVVSYVAGVIAIPKYMSQRSALMLCAALGIVLSFGAVFSGHSISVWFIASLGLCNALLWPSTWPLALDGLGKLVKQGSAILIMGVVGGAVIPLIYGLLSDRHNPQIAYWVLLPSYAYLLFYAAKGCALRKRKPAGIDDIAHVSAETRESSVEPR